VFCWLQDPAKELQTHPSASYNLFRTVCLPDPVAAVIVVQV